MISYAVNIYDSMVSKVAK